MSSQKLKEVQVSFNRGQAVVMATALNAMVGAFKEGLLLNELKSQRDVSVK